jgi:hypothetical protein
MEAAGIDYTPLLVYGHLAGLHIHSGKLLPEPLVFGRQFLHLRFKSAPVCVIW